MPTRRTLAWLTLLISSLVLWGARDQVFAQRPWVPSGVEGLVERVEQLEKRLNEATENGQVLAVVVVKDRKLVPEKSSRDTKFENGKVSFPNARHLRIVPLIADAQESSYITEHQWIAEFGVDREDANRSYFLVKSHAMDTGGPDRTSAAHNFTAVVIGFDDTRRP